MDDRRSYFATEGRGGFLRVPTIRVRWRPIDGDDPGFVLRYVTGRRGHSSDGVGTETSLHGLDEFRDFDVDGVDPRTAFTRSR